MTHRKLRIAITGGGTGGHLSPALATIDSLQVKLPPDQLSLMYLGSRGGTEASVVPLLGIPFRAVTTGKLRRYLSVENALDAFRIPIGVLQALYHLLVFRPDVIFATGGYVSVPTVIAGWMLHKKILMHEQTGTLGLANRINARFASDIALSFENTTGVPARLRAVVTGNPVRREVFAGTRDEAARHFNLSRDLPTVYVTGGAQGAHIINQTVQAILPKLLEAAQVIHQCGSAPGTQADYESLLQTVKQLPENLQRRYVLHGYIGQEIGLVYALADLVVSRAGAGTVNELATLGKPAVLIPLPGTRYDEQTKNAERFANLKAGVMIEQARLTPQYLLDTVRSLLSDRGKLEKMSAAGRSASSEGAANHIARLLIEIAQRS